MKKLTTTSSPLVTQDFLGGYCPENDMLLRITSDNERKNLAVTYYTTQTIRNDLSSYFNMHLQEINLLRSVIFWQKRTIDYQALHTAFLLNSISEEEFEQEAEKFIVHKEKIPAERISFVVQQLESLIEIKFDTSDYADYFQCSQENVMSGLRLLSDQRFSAMLPDPSEGKETI